MVSFESAYVALSRMKQHAQVYTDNRDKWVAAMENRRRKVRRMTFWSRAATAPSRMPLA